MLQVNAWSFLNSIISKNTYDEASVKEGTCGSMNSNVHGLEGHGSQSLGC